MTTQTETNKSALPEGWKWVRLGEVCTINPTKTKFSRSLEADTSFIPMAAVDEYTGTVAKPEIVPYKKVMKGYTYFEENDVLFAKITPCMQNGKHVIARNLIDRIGFGTTEFHVLKCNDGVIPEWLWYFIRRPSFLDEAIGYFTGAVGQQRIPEYFLSDYSIPLPPLPEQKRIAAKIQELMAEAAKLQSALNSQQSAIDLLLASYLRQVFESDEAKKWERKRLGECIARKKGINIKGLPVKNYQQSGKYPIVDQGNNIICGYTDDQTKVYKNELPVIIFGDHTRIFKYVDFSFAIGADGTKIIMPNKDIIIPLFFYYALLSLTIKNLGYSRHYKLLKAISIPLPPLPEQKQIVARVQELMSEAEQLKSVLRNQQSAIEALPGAILRKAFQGEL